MKVIPNSFGFTNSTGREEPVIGCSWLSRTSRHSCSTFVTVKGLSLRHRNIISLSRVDAVRRLCESQPPQIRVNQPPTCPTQHLPSGSKPSPQRAAQAAKDVTIAPADSISVRPGADHTVGKAPDPRQQRIWDYVSRWPMRSLWDLQGIPFRVVAKRTWKSFLADNLLGHAAELGFYFLFALFPTLFSASSILGLAARSASDIYDKLLHYLALVIPTDALGAVLATFNETTQAATSGKLTFGLVAAIWSASAGISAIQDTLNGVYKVQDTRPYWKARIYAIGLTVVLTVIVTVILACMLGGDFFAALAHYNIYHRYLATTVAFFARLIGWTLATALLALSFAVIYYWAPDVKTRCWHWLTPGGAVGIVGWLLASLGLRVYLHFFNTFSITYGSLGAVIILLMWFYITGLMLLLGAEINSEIEAAAVEKRLAGPSAPPPSADIPARAPIQPSAQPGS
jgi:membrane protein